MKKLGAVIFWSIVAAAFIGPGTVTTAASAGAAYGPALLWALAFSTLACLVLQEAGARLTVASGSDLARSLATTYRGGWGVLIKIVVLGAIVLGCAAYQVGNLLGASAGIGLASEIPVSTLVLGLGVLAAVLMWFAAPATLTRLLSVLVVFMGIAFMVTALLLRPDPVELLTALTVPRFPPGAGLLVLGLIGTTVVPYNLFLGSGLARGQDLATLRFGLSVAVVLGGLISMAVLITGTAVEGAFSFAGLAEVLGERLGPWATSLVAYGLAAAGLSSAVTAPLAAAITARGLFARAPEDPENAEAAEDPRWSPTSLRFRLVWLSVLAVGVGFGVAGLQPIPAIIAAQAFNGVVLPLVAVFLWLSVNDRGLMGPSAVNGRWANLATAPVVLIALVLGINGVLKAGYRTVGLAAPEQSVLFTVSLSAALLLGVPLARALRARSRREP